MRNTARKHSTLSFKVPPGFRERLTLAAKRAHVDRSTLIRRTLEASLSEEHVPTGGSVVDLASDLLGSVEGPGDLSTNKDRMKGYGR